MVARVDHICEAVTHAQKLGTLNALDRSRQYPLDSDEKVKEAVNQAWTKIHHLEREGDRKDAKIVELEKKVSRWRFLAHSLTSILTVLAWEGVKALFNLLPYLR